MVPSDDLLGGAWSKAGTGEGEMEKGQGIFSTLSLPRGSKLEYFIPGSGCVGGCGEMGYAEAGDLNMAQSENLS